MTAGRTRATSGELGLTLDDGVRASTSTTPVLACWPPISSRERVARRESATIAHDKNMTLQV